MKINNSLCWVVLTALMVQCTPAIHHNTIKSYPTGGTPIYHLKTGNIADKNRHAIIATSFDGTISAYQKEGELIWSSPTGGFFPNDLQVEDLDNDGYGETLVASADGTLYMISHKGEIIWKYQTPAPLMAVCVTKNNGQTLIHTGGAERKIITLSTAGQLLNYRETPYMVRFIRKVKLGQTSQQDISVLLAKVVRGQYYLQAYHPQSLIPIWNEDVNLSTEKMNEGNCYFDLLTTDINNDGKEEIILTQGWRSKGRLSAYNAEGKRVELPDYATDGVTTPTYRMNRITHIKSPTLNDEFFIGVFGNQLLLYNKDLSLRKTFTNAQSFTGGTFDATTNCFILGSSISGGDCFHLLDLQDPSWGEQFESLLPSGRMAEITHNIELLSQQVASFVKPEYQPDQIQIPVMGTMPDQKLINTLKNVTFQELTSFHEAYDRSSLPGIWKTKKETRYSYNDLQEQIWDTVRAKEKAGLAFNSWAGHGNDPFYMQMETLKGIIENAPNSFQAFVFPEMERVDQAMEQAINFRVKPLAQLCKEHGKKIILRNKNVFWYGSCYLPLWKSTLFDPQLQDVFVPSMEETNCRTQDLSLSAQVGLMMTGKFSHYCARAVTDNAVYHRMWEWSSQQMHHHFIRAMMLQATLGADMFMINIHQGDPAQMNLFYTMLDKGIITIPKPADLLSVSDLCIGIANPSADFIEHGGNGWDISGYTPSDRTFVFDRLDCFWGGAPTLPHDFSFYGTGTKNRMLNFLPKNPYGYIPFVPSDFEPNNNYRFKTKLITDGEYFYDSNGNRHTAEAYKPMVEQELKLAATRLPVRVEGDVAWNVVRLDSHHIRIYLIDPGYMDPAKRLAKVFLQKLNAIKATDILNRVDIPIDNNTFETTVPAGIFRIIDLQHN